MRKQYAAILCGCVEKDMAGRCIAWRGTDFAAHHRFKHSLRTRLLILALLIWAMPLSAQQLAECLPQRPLKQGIVTVVYDGDTVRIDTDIIRFIGINTPEIATNTHIGQAYARQAQQVLQPLRNASVKWYNGVDTHDRYKRNLGHIFITPTLAKRLFTQPWAQHHVNQQQPVNLTAVLLDGGYGWVVAIVPNDAHQRCYSVYEQRALQHNRGVWGLPTYNSIAAESLRVEQTGFWRVNGVVERVTLTKKSLWIDLQGPLAVRIATKNLVRFGGAANVKQWQGTRIYVRGWLIDRGSRTKYKRMMLSISHPNMLEKIM